MTNLYARWGICLNSPRWRVRRAFIWALLVLATVPDAAAQDAAGPQPPCGGPVAPAYPDPEHSPAARVWSGSELGRTWAPPPCTGWSGSGFSTLIAIAARFRNPAGADDLRRRIAAVSGLKGIQYWSTTGKRWQTLILDAYALESPGGNRRADFSPDEVAGGKVLYFHQEDNLSGKAEYRLRIRVASPQRLVFETDNVSPIRYLVITLFEPGEARAIYFLDRESSGVWRFYSLARTRGNASSLMAGHAASFLNRAVALYRHLAGIPTDRDPPAAR
jgi:hypothetical protein